MLAHTVAVGRAAEPFLIDQLYAGAAAHPGKTLFTFINDDDTVFSLSYGQMLAASQRVARDILTRAAPGERALLLYPPGADYIVAFVACLLAAVIPVPCYPPTNARNSGRVQHIAQDSGAKLALSDSRLCDKLSTLLSCERWLAAECQTALADTSRPVSTQAPTPALDDIAFLQYTSGSTSAPKGVMVTHRNLAHNLSLLRDNFGFSSTSVGATWLPPYHDMGLIVGLLQYVYSGASTVVLAPASFLHRPYRWLKAVSDYRATHIGAPNFAFELCCQKISAEQQATLDLGSLEVVFCGAEPIRADTLQRFDRQFAGCGFRSQAWLPCYGLAEATLLVSGSVRRRSLRLAAVPETGPGHDDTSAAEAHRVIAGSGWPVEGMQLLIVDPERHTQVAAGAIGEIWLAGPSVAAGYWNQPQASHATFGATLRGQPDGRRFLRTGDLGFVHDGELHVCSRLKDLIILNGKNIFPQDLESASFRSDARLRNDGAAAYATEEAVGSRLVVVQELDFRQPASAELARLAADAVFEQTDTLPDTVLLVKAGAIPRTSSGKIQRRQCQADVRLGKLDVLARWDRSDPQLLAQIWADVLQVDHVDAGDNFFALGGHSLMAAQILARLRARFGVDLPMTMLFEAPTIQALAPLIEQYQAAGAASPQAHSGTPLRANPDDRHLPFPLTGMQEAYWIGRRSDMEHGGVATHGYLELRLDDFDPERLHAALNKLIARHDMLRAVVRPDGTQQVLASVPPYQVKLNDMRARSAAELAEALAQAREELSHQVLPADTWPLFELRATRHAEHSALLHVSLDLLMMDAWSIELFLCELGQLYRDPACEQPPLAVTFRDYLLAEQTWRGTPAHDRALQYWRARLADFAPAPQLPLLKAASAPRFARRSLALPPARWQQLKQHAVDAAVTPSAALLAAFALVLASWSKQPRFTINLTLFNRAPLHPQVQQLIGDFTSLILLEADLDLGSTFTDIARALQSQLWNDIDHALVSGVEVLRELNRHHGARQDGMNVVFTSTLTDDVHADLPERLGETVYCVSQTPQVCLDLQVAERNGALALSWDAPEALFPEGVLDAMFGAYGELLQRLAQEAPLWRQSAIGLLPAAQRSRQDAANATDHPVSDLLLHQLFDLQAQRTPQHSALIAPGRTLSYADLQAEARALAGQLRRRGAGRGQLVAVVMEKGWEQVVAVMAILYSGAAYVPLDPALPAARMRHLVDHTGALLALTQSWLGKLALPADIERIDVDRLRDAGTTEVSEAPEAPEAEPGDLAYVIYTSGSTGMPKGVAIDHRGAVNTVLDINQRFRVGGADRVLALSSLSFDLSVYDIFGALAAGAAVVMPSHADAGNPSHWLQLLGQHGVTVWNSVPALLGLLLDQAGAEPAPLRSLRLAMLSGDWIPLPLPGRLRSVAAQVEVFSLGGATEASIWSIHHPVDAVAAHWTSIPYGTPLRNQQMHVLDSAMNPRPAWVPGQLYIGGIGLAREYWRDAERTNASFVHHPRTGERLYKTGDMGRYLPDGSIEFLGREDNQVKVQGYRIELGEIEVALSALAGVASAAAAVLGEAQGAKRLAAYIVAQAGHAPDEAGLRAALAASLPSYMVPSIFVFLPAMPLSSNGKLDRRALPAPSADKAAPVAQAAAASAATAEQRIAAVVESVLGSGPLAADANLFYAGLTSLDVVRISNALAVELDFRPSMEDMLTTPTIERLGAAYRRQAAARHDNNDDKRSYVLIDEPQARAAFKQQQQGIRSFRATTTRTALAQPLRRDDAGRYRSAREFCATPIDAAAFAGLLHCLAPHSADAPPKYGYASAGGLYPVQLYIDVKPERIDGIAGGTYYYDPQQHALLALDDHGLMPAEAYDQFVNRPLFNEAAFSLFFIAELAAIEPVYGDHSMAFCQLEAGAMAQLLRMSAADRDLGLCLVGSLDFPRIRDRFALADSHRLVVSMLGGKLRPHAGHARAQGTV